MRFKVISVARLVPWKGVQEIIEVIEQIQNTQLTIVGDGDLRNELENMVERKGLKARVLFTGSVSKQTVESLLAGNDLFVLNSSYEGLPHIVLEAMKAGTPVIATNVGGTPELVKDYHNGLLIPVSKPLLMDAVKKIMEDNKLRDTLITNGYKTVENFSQEKMVQETEQLLKETLLVKLPRV